MNSPFGPRFRAGSLLVLSLGLISWACADDQTVSGNLHVTGNVGVGTSSSGAQVAITSPDPFAQILAVSDSSADLLFGLSGDLTTGNMLVTLGGAGSNAPYLSLDQASSEIGLGGAETLYLTTGLVDATGNARVHGDLTVDGTITQSGSPVLTTTSNGSGLTNLNASALTSGTVPAALLPTEAVQVAATQTLTNKTLQSATLTGTTVVTSGNLGVGVSAPLQKLDVSGSVNVSGGYLIGNSVVLSTPPSGSIAVGIGAMANATTGSALNVAVGANSMTSLTTAQRNTGVGYGTMYWGTTGSSNTALGDEALTGLPGFGMVGSANTALGATALYTLTTGSSNTAVGQNAMRGNNITGNSNVVVGDSAFFSATSGSANIILGQWAGATLTTGSTNILIGHAVDVPSANQSNFINIGNTIYGNSATGNVGIGTISPTARLQVKGGAFQEISGADNWSGIYLDAPGTDEPKIGFRVSDNSERFRIHFQGVNASSERLAFIKTLAGEAEVMSVLATGNVGIGTTTPVEKLEVAGNVKVQGSLTAGGVPVLTSTGNGSSLTNLNASALTSGTMAAARLPVEAVQLTATQTLTNKTLQSATLAGTTVATGNVGIQTTAPQGALTLGAGQLTVPAGSAAAPTYTFNDNLNTGLFSSGTSSVSLSTNGIERFRIYGTGNFASDDFVNLPGVVSNASYKSFHLASPGVKGSTMLSLASRNFSTAFLGDRMGDFIIGNEGARPIIFKNGMIYRNSDTLNTGTEQMRIDASGNVGIGTATPELKLHIKDVWAGIRLESTAQGYASSGSLYGGAGGIFFRNDVAGTNPFSVSMSAPTSSLEVAANGNVGIGTNVPATKLDIVGSARVSGSLTVAGTTTGNGSGLTNLNASALTSGTVAAARLPAEAVQVAAAQTLTNKTLASANFTGTTVLGGSSAAQQVLVGPMGNVGIGSGNPYFGLDIYNGHIVFGNVASQTDQGGDPKNIGMAWASAGQPNVISNLITIDRAGNYGGDFKFYGRDPGGGPMPSALMTITSAGNVGIGTASPSLAKLQVAGNIFSTGVDNVFVGIDDQPRPRFGLLKKAGYAGMLAHSNNVNFIIGMTDASTIDPTGFTQIAQQFVIDTIGNVGIGTTAPAEKLEVAGNVKVQGGLTVGGVSVLTSTGNGSGLTNLNASALTTGTMAAARLPVEAVQLTATQTLTNKTLQSATLAGTTVATGNVGIQTFAPQGALTIGSGQLTVPVGSAAAPSYAFNDNLNTGLYSSGTNTVSLATNGIERLRVYGTGNFASDDFVNLPGVVSNASYKSFHLASPGVKGSTMISMASRNFSTAFLGDRLGDFIIGNEGARPIIFKNGMIYKNSDTLNTGTEQMRIDANGNVGIGTASPLAKLAVAGDVAISGNLKTDVITQIVPLVIRGTGLNHAATRLIQIGSLQITNNSSRGLTLTIISKSTHAVVSSINYDVHGSSTASDQLATALNAVTQDQIGILTSCDSWNVSITVDLRNAFKRLGLTKAQVISSLRLPYAAIFEGASGGVASAKATEVVMGNDPTQPYAEIRGWLIDGSYAVTPGTVSNALYNDTGDVQAAVVDHSGVVAIKAGLRVPAAGDLSMGTFTTGTNPAN
jgi:hypothetical protein